MELPLDTGDRSLARSGLLSRYRVVHLDDGDVEIQSKDSGKRIKIALKDIDDELHESQQSYACVLERIVSRVVCVSCERDLTEGQFGLCEACAVDRISTVLQLREDLSEKSCSGA